MIRPSGEVTVEAAELVTVFHREKKERKLKRDYGLQSRSAKDASPGSMSKRYGDKFFDECL